MQRSQRPSSLGSSSYCYPLRRELSRLSLRMLVARSCKSFTSRLSLLRGCPCGVADSPVALGRKEKSAAQRLVVRAPRHIPLKRGYLPVTRTSLRSSSLECASVRFRSISLTLLSIERNGTAAHSAAPEHNLATRQFPACQGWGRGFESLRPLQVLIDRSHGFSTAFCDLKGWPGGQARALGYRRVTRPPGRQQTKCHFRALSFGSTRRARYVPKSTCSIPHR